MQDRFKFRYHNNNKIYDVSAIDFTRSRGEIVSLDKMETLMCKLDLNNLIQCTGLKDKNGKLIYEGDIVKGTCGVYWGLMVVEYLENRASFIYRRLDGKYYPLSMLGECNFEELLGNVYENPELLKEYQEHEISLQFYV